MSDINQDDIDKLLQDALAAPAPHSSPANEPAPAEERGPASQDDIDALFAAAGSDAPPKPAAAEPSAPAPAAPGEDLSGTANQDDIDALFSSLDGADDEAKAPADELEGVADQDDIDALFAAVGDPGGTGPSDGAAPNGEPETETTFEPPISDALFESQLAQAEAEADSEVDGAKAELDELLSSIAGEDAPEAKNPAAAGKDETVQVDSVDMDELLRQVTQAAPPPPPPPAVKMKPMQGLPALNADTAILDMNSPHITEALAQAGHTPPPRPAPLPPPPVAMPPPSGERREFSVLYGAGEVESVANQISALISSMAEKAHGYMQAWIAADSEAKDLRTRALGEERRRTTLEGEKEVLRRELDQLRSRVAELEGAKIAADEARRTLETARDARLRELDSRITLLTSESESLKDELTRARNQATGVDIESRRARFEADRLKNEVESERMERLRIQRALENREKEIQALQTQSAGQASSLFIDELHRLVRRLESELDARTSGAHEALKQLDRLDVPADMVPVTANLRAALMQAIGADADPDDALKSLGREAEGVRGPQAVAPGKAEMISFETALSTYNLSGALDVAGALLREARATPGKLMRTIYQCPALRRPGVADRLPDLARLLEGLRTVQESNDRSRGRETGESEVFYVQMFDFLHNLVRLKIINRLTGDVWRIFLDLRGRFSFVTSDKQWAEYRDQTLSDKGVL